MWIWVADEEAIAEAQKELDDYNTQKAIDAIDDEIQAWKDYKKTWDDIPSDFEKMTRALNAQEILGANAEADILNKRIDTFNDFKAGYLKILQDIEDATAQSAKKQQELQLQMTTNALDSANNGGSGNNGGSKNRRQIPPNPTPTPDVATPIIQPIEFARFRGEDWVKFADIGYNDTNFMVVKGTPYYSYDPKTGIMSYKGTSTGYAGDHILNHLDIMPSNIREAVGGGGGGKATLQTKASGSPFINRSGLYNINENGAELGIHNPARGSYTFLTHGDGILNAGLTRNIMALAQNPELAIRNVLGHILASGNNTTTNAQSQIINIQNVNLPNVNNATQFVKQLQLISQNH